MLLQGDRFEDQKEKVEEKGIVIGEDAKTLHFKQVVIH